MNKFGLLAIVVLVAAGVAVGMYVLHSGGPGTSSNRPTTNFPYETANDATGIAQPKDPEKAALEKLNSLTLPADRIAHLKWAASREWAKSDSPILRNAIATDPDESVQLAAVEEAVALATKEGPDAMVKVVRTALTSTKGNTRARGLKAAREHPQPALVPELIALVDAGDAYASMALNALAYTDTPEAKAKILAAASDESISKPLRARAVTLLAVTKDMDALDLLRDLANGSDLELKAIAEEVLKVILK